ncbi:UbiA-domain-containing protein [Schizophyllum commune H4-8]|uniref:UbiA-domain-containing protein n=1 Tax=Schizophyllum commune (strain H4-8 / FGSC 9210) TaxID=578458 RepID=UPI00215F41BE|nr:UbiA-domain-containing protein [Schizophyllum commune H4-8]KAI5885265.1 UbiA-domain-containing protein [Schizophyllum commune H4-8]
MFSSGPSTSAFDEGYVGTGDTLLPLNVDRSASASLDASTPRPPSLFALPTKTELRACWELGRLSNGMGCWVCWFPLAFSMTMAYHAHHDMPFATLLARLALYLGLCSGIKSVIMTIDDILDHDIDARVARTKNRALPRGAISRERAWLWFVLQCVVGVGLGWVLLNRTTLFISMFVWPIFVIYPTCKRWMDFAPVPLAFMFNIGALMGWTDVDPNDVPWKMLAVVYAACGFWTLTFETVYQHQDKLDDILIGARSLALFMGRRTVPFCATTAAAFVGLLSAAAFLNGHGPIFYVAAFVALARLLLPLRTLDVDVPKQCLQYFLLTPKVGAILLLGFLGDALLSRWAARLAL